MKYRPSILQLINLKTNYSSKIYTYDITNVNENSVIFQYHGGAVKGWSPSHAKSLITQVPQIVAIRTNLGDHRQSPVIFHRPGY